MSHNERDATRFILIASWLKAAAAIRRISTIAAIGHGDRPAQPTQSARRELRGFAMQLWSNRSERRKGPASLWHHRMRPECAVSL